MTPENYDGLAEGSPEKTLLEKLFDIEEEKLGDLRKKFGDELSMKLLHPKAPGK